METDLPNKNKNLIKNNIFLPQVHIWDQIHQEVLLTVCESTHLTSGVTFESSIMDIIGGINSESTVTGVTGGITCESTVIDITSGITSESTVLDINGGITAE